MKFCGKHESCFEDGSKFWGHFGNVMCYHLCEKDIDGKCSSICGKDDLEVRSYSNIREYLDLLELYI